MVQETRGLSRHSTSHSVPYGSTGGCYIRALPVELLILVFTKLSAEPDAGAVYPSRSVSLVCRDWNNIALSNPALWTSVPSFSVGRVAQSQVKGPAQSIVQNAFSQSLVPTSFSIQDCSAHRAAQELLKPIFSHSPNITQLELVRLSSNAFAVVSKAFTLNGLPHLCTLRLHVVPSLSDHPRLCAFEDCPKLRDVELDYDGVSGIKLPWAQLTRYVERSGPRVHGLAQILSQTSSIEQLSYKRHSGRPTGYADYHPSTILTLKHLNIDIEEGNWAALDLVTSSTFPSLEHLRSVAPPHNTVAALIALIERSRCSLTTLVLLPGPTVIPKLAPLLRICPSIRRLEVSNLSPSHMEVLFTRSRQREPLAPLLEECILHLNTSFQVAELTKLLDPQHSGLKRQFDISRLSFFRINVPHVKDRVQLHIALGKVPGPLKTLQRLSNLVENYAKSSVVRSEKTSGGLFRWSILDKTGGAALLSTLEKIITEVEAVEVVLSRIYVPIYELIRNQDADVSKQQRTKALLSKMSSLVQGQPTILAWRTEGPLGLFLLKGRMYNSTTSLNSLLAEDNPELLGRPPGQVPWGFLDLDQSFSKC
ncbi:hypothetical protein FA15DRAFT_761271 [Coprinopsis marcescibilis]|uniref:F-box domain-containing protein n=1 Tax=Coprinopsis marcescibilis TaxID=230819 RepID=A0A5C3KA25_COPMA|nr:hypothetical protein FA15DRAFT_761271 [Coprinopsis marcescibilis]